MSKRYVIKEGKTRDGIQDILVGHEGGKDFEMVGVWVSERSGIHCVDYSGPLQAMSGSCAHVKAVKRYLKRKRGE